MPRPCLRVGLTGGIGSGKTTVSEMFADLDVPVIDADVIARELLLPGTPASELVIDAFGENITSSTGAIDRNKLRAIVFNDEQSRKTLESIIHPHVYKQIDQLVSQVSSPYCIIVVPLLFETGKQGLVDRTLVVDAPFEQQVERACARDNTRPDDISKIISAQMPAQQRRELADDVIENQGTIEDLSQQVNVLDAHYRQLAQNRE